MSGRKRHILVDTQGLLLAAVVHPADIQERDGAYAVLAQAAPQTRHVQHLWADAAYRGDFVTWVQPRRWVVERTFAWLGRNRRLSKDYEEYPASSETWLYLAMSHLLLRRLCPNFMIVVQALTHGTRAPPAC